MLIDLDMPGCFKRVEALGVDMEAFSKASITTGGSGATISEGITATGVMNLYQVGGVTTDEFIDDILSWCRAGTTPQQVIDAWNSCLLTIPDYKLDYIKELRRRGYHTYLLSNTNDLHWQHCLQSKFPEPIDHYFDHCFVSHEMQLAKPDIRIFQKVMETLKPSKTLKPSETLFIDDCHTNCLAAEELGIRTFTTPVLYDWRQDVEKIAVNIA